MKLENGVRAHRRHQEEDGEIAKSQPGKQA
jgi:hypothetical protein